MCSRNSFVLLGLILVLVPMLAVVAYPSRNITKRSPTFFDLDCKGTFNKPYFFRLDRICEDCYSLFREPQLLTMCKKDCFTTNYFKGCVEALQLSDELETIKRYIQVVNGAAPDDN